MAWSPRSRRVLVPKKLAEMLSQQGVPESGLVVYEATWPPVAKLTQASAAILWHREPAKLASYLLEHQTAWEWMHSLWTGLEHLPLREIHSKVKVLTVGRGTGAIPLTEWTVLALLWHAKRVPEVQESFRRGGWDQLTLGELWGSTVVILGLGALGQHLAQTLKKFGVQVVGVRRRPRPTLGCSKVVGLSELSRVCAGARALVVALPATQSTTDLVGQEVLEALPTGSLVVNIGRAAVVNEKALFAQVASGRLWAALDVWWQEPLPADSPWRKLPQVFPSPHGAYRSEHFLERHVRRIAENITAYLAGKPMKAAVSTKQWKEILGDGGGS